MKFQFSTWQTEPLQDDSESEQWFEQEHDDFNTTTMRRFIFFLKLSSALMKMDAGARERPPKSASTTACSLAS